MTTHEMLGAALPESDPLRLIEELRAGLPSRALKTFKEAAGLADEDVADLLQIGGRTLTRVRASRAKKLSPDLSDRLFAIASVYALAGDVFGDHESAVGWMDEPQFALGDRPPRELLSSELGRDQVRALLRRIEHGMLA